MKWNCFIGNIENHVKNQDELYIVSDGEKISLARWSCLVSDNPECGADHDEYEFKNDIYPYVVPRYYWGPVRL